MTDIRIESWFDKNPKKTIFSIILFSCLFFDFLAGFLLLPKVTENYHPYYHHDLKKNQKTPQKCEGRDYFIYTNSLGFKDSRIKKITLDNSKYRIVFLGDSFTEGVGYPYEKTFVGLINRNMDKSKIEILNAAAKSYSPKLYYLKIKYLLEEIKLSFNELYVFIDISDVQDEIIYENFTPSKQAFFKEIDIFFKNSSYTYNRIRKYLLKRSVLNKFTQIARPNKLDYNNEDKLDMDSFDELFYQERPKWTYDEKVFQKWGEKGLLLSEQYMKKLFLLCKNNAIKMTIAVYPWPSQIRKGDLDSIQVKFWKNFAEKYGIDFLNYFPDFINEANPDEIIDKYFIQGDVHLNEKGHEVFAKKLLDKMKNNLAIYHLMNEVNSRNIMK